MHGIFEPRAQAHRQVPRRLSYHRHDTLSSIRRALREREEALLTCHALADELDGKRGEIAGLEQEGSKARSKADLVRRPARRNRSNTNAIEMALCADLHFACWYIPALWSST